MQNNTEANSDIISSIDRIFLVEVRAGVKLGNNSVSAIYSTNWMVQYG